MRVISPTSLFRGYALLKPTGHDIVIVRGARSALSKSLKSTLKSAERSFGENPGNAEKLLRATGFCIGVSGATYVGCAIWNYENVRSKLRLSSVAEDLSRRFFGSRDQMRQLWTELSEGKKLIVGIIAVNCIVTVLWQVKSLQPFMARYFLADPAAKRMGLPLLLSVFSHSSPFHLFCNMYVLWSFSESVIHIFGKEQFFFFYITAGLFSGLASTSNKFLQGIRHPSLGASGAIIAALAAVCTQFPNAKLSIIFLPMYTFSAENALKFLMGVEIAGLLFRWRFFDHAAHLSGILFGIWYVKYGHTMTWAHRKPIVDWWHYNVRGGDSRR